MIVDETRRLETAPDGNQQLVELACHDFRTPLATIKEFAAILQEGLAGDVTDEQAEFLGIILGEVDRLSLMIDRFQEQSRLCSSRVGGSVGISLAARAGRGRKGQERRLVAENVFGRRNHGSKT